MIVALLIILSCVLISGAFGKKHGRSVPVTARGAWPVVGHTFIVLRNIKDLYTFIKDVSMDSVTKGGICVVKLAGTDLYDPDDANTVLNASLKKDIFYDYFKIWLGDGLITATETIWKRHRKLLNPTFNQVVLDSYLPELNRQARLLILDLDSHVGKGKFDHAPALERMTLQTICSTAMGVAIDNEDKQMRENYIKAKSEFEIGSINRAQTFWLHSDIIYKYSNLCRVQRDLAKTLDGLTTAIIKKRRTETTGKDFGNEQTFKPFLDRLLQMGDDGIFTDNEVKEEVDTFTFAGSDTMSVALTVTLLAIGSYPEVQQKIVKELGEVFQDSERDVNKRDLSQLEYLEAVIKEVLRLHPVIPIVARTLEHDLKIRNYCIPGGSRCFVSMYGMHRHPMWGRDAESFRPERWLLAATPPRHHAFAAFSLGKRGCIGPTFSMMWLKTALCHVLRRYRVSGDVTQLEQAIEVVARPVPKDYISIERRMRADYIGQK